jgi:predicted RNase H-like nuclease (RuvC/YqgF family)
MPTLEERLEVLERALSAMKIEHIYDVRQLDERVTALHRQLAEQRQRLDEQGQAISQLGQTIDVKLDGLMQVLVQQFAAVGARFDAMDQKFVAGDARFTGLEERIDRQTVEIKAKFEDRASAFPSPSGRG